jgi:hypothetical protein
MENVAEITAWLPTTAASVATTNTGQNTGSARHYKLKLHFVPENKEGLG